MGIVQDGAISELKSFIHCLTNTQLQIKCSAIIWKSLYLLIRVQMACDSDHVSFARHSIVVDPVSLYPVSHEAVAVSPTNWLAAENSPSVSDGNVPQAGKWKQIPLQERNS